MSFKELASEYTPHGLISLRRRTELRLNNTVLYEVKLGEEFLMSSLFTEAEIQLSHLGLKAIESLGEFSDGLDVVVGGLGLGYTAAAALEHKAVRHLAVVDVMQPVIDWHQQGLVPLGKQLCADDRCELICGDFFALALEQGAAFDGKPEHQKVHAILLDIDHSPSRWLNPGNSRFYSAEGLQGIAAKLHSGGVFGLWSDDLPDPAFEALLAQHFDRVESEVVPFVNPYTGGESTNSVYLAFKN